MLQLYNANKEKLEGLIKYKDLKIESTLSTGDKLLSFYYPKKYSNNIIEEGYIRTKEAEFVIKQINKTSDAWIDIKASLNVEELENMIENFDSTEQTIEACINFALAGTGWTVNVDKSITKKRTVRKTSSSIWDILKQVKATYRVEIEFDTINKVVIVKEQLGNDKGVYFIEDLNLRALGIQSNSYDFYTRILAIGKGELKVEVENYSYSKKKKTFIWKDERYIDEESLRLDATLKLEEIAKPYKAYSADIIDLAKSNKKYKEILNYKLGDTITLISKENKIREKQRIVKLVEYPDSPENNTVEISNMTLSYEDVQKDFQEISDTIINITEDNGTISERALRDSFKHSNPDNMNVQELNAVKVRVGELEATRAFITDLNAVNAQIDNLKAVKADITDLTAKNLKFDVASGKTLDLQTLLAKFITGENGQFLNITSSNTTIANAVIKDAMLDTISANKLNSGVINSNLVNIKGSNGNLLIKDNTIQIKDDNRVRVQIGKDATDDYNMYIWDSNGKLMFDATGLKADGIKTKIIRDDMVSDTANIAGSKINISSLISEFNKDTNVTLIQASKVALDTTGQSLELSFNSLKTNVETKENRNLLRGSDVEKTNTKEFVQYADIAPIIDKYGLIEYTISFDLKSKDITNKSSIQVYCQNGSDSKYYIGHNPITVTTEYARYSITVTPELQNGTETSAYLAFYGEYNTGNIPVVKNVKVEIGSAKNPTYSKAPEDLEEEIISNTTSISVVQGQINTLISESTINKGEITTLKDQYTNIEATVNGINTTVASHTTNISNLEGSINNLSGQVTTVDTKYSRLEQNLEGFKTTVSSTYINKTELDATNNNLTSLDARISSAEQKITDTAIINTVQSTINNAKDEAILSANNATDTKLLSYATTASMELNNNQLKLSFSSSGGYNLVKNGGFKNGLTGWHEGLYNPNGTNRSIEIVNESSEWVLDGTYALCMRSTNNTSGEFRVDSQKFKVKRNTTYTLSYLVAAHRVTKMGHYIRGNEWDIITTKDYAPGEGGKNRNNWTRITQTFNTGDNHQININFIHFTTENDAYSWITDVMINEGDIALSWSPHPDEIYSGNTTIDASGVTIYNGAITIKNNAGLDVIKGDKDGNITIKGIFEQYAVNTGYKSIEIQNNNINIYDWTRDGDLVGRLGSSTKNSNGRGMVSLKADTGNILSLGYQTTATSGVSVFEIDDTKTGLGGIARAGFLDDIGMFDYTNIDFTGNDRKIPLARIDVATSNNFMILGNQAYNSIVIGYMSTGDINNYISLARFNSDGMYVWGNIKCSGTKTRVVPTENFDGVRLNALETPEPVFEDIGEGVIDSEGLCYIFIDPIMQETINTKCDYQVFLQKYGEGEIFVSERKENYFLINGTPNLKFGWRFVVKQKGYETDRLEREIIEILDGFKAEEKEESIVEELAINYLTDYEKEMLEND